MGEFFAIVLPICGLGLLCVGVIAVGAFLFLRSSGFDISNVIEAITGGLGQDNIDDLDESAFPVRKKKTLRARVDALDFDESVKKYSGTSAQSAPRPSFDQFDRAGSPDREAAAANRNPSSGNFERDQQAGFFNDERENNLSEQPLRRNLRRRGGRDDEAFGGMLDDEGDGIIDY